MSMQTCVAAATSAILSFLTACKFDPDRVLLNLGPDQHQQHLFTGPTPMFMRSKIQSPVMKMRPSAIINMDSSLNLNRSDFRNTAFAPWFFVDCQNPVKSPTPLQRFSSVDQGKLSKTKLEVKTLCSQMLVECFWYRGSTQVITSWVLHSNLDGGKCPVLEKFFNLTGHTIIASSALSSIPNFPKYIYALDEYLMDTACNLMNCKVEMNPVAGGFGVELRNKTWNGMIGDIQNGPDNNIGILVPSIDRTAAIDFTTGPLYDTYNAILSRKPRQVLNLFVMVQPFTVESWAAIFASVAVTSVSLALLASFGTDASFSVAHLRRLLPGAAACTLETLVAQCPEREISDAVQFRLGSLGFQLAAIVLTVAYSSMLTALIALPNYERTIDDFDDVAALKATIYSHSLGGFAIQRATEDMKRLGGGTLTLPPNSFFPYEEILNAFDQEAKGYMTTYAMLSLNMNMQLTDTVMQEFYMSKRKMYPRIYSFVTKKQSIYWRYFEHYSFINAAFGFPQLHERQFIRSKRGLYITKIQVPHVPQRQIQNYVAPYLIWGIGTVLSILAFVVEQIWARSGLRLAIIKSRL